MPAPPSTPSAWTTSPSPNPLYPANGKSAPAEAQAGALLPFAGYKGFGLGLVVQALGVLGGAGMVTGAQDGYLFIAFRPDLLISLEQCKREVSALVARVKAVPRAPGVAGIRIPGENSARNRERLSREGLDLDQLVYDELHRMAGNRE